MAQTNIYAQARLAAQADPARRTLFAVIDAHPARQWIKAASVFEHCYRQQRATNSAPAAAINAAIWTTALLDMAHKHMQH